MTFKVDPAALLGYSAQVERAKEDAAQCRKYFSANAGDIAFSGAEA